MENINVIATSLPQHEESFLLTTSIFLEKNNLVSKCYFIGADITKGAQRSMNIITKKIDNLRESVAKDKKLSLQILVNNVGLSNNYPKTFIEHETFEIENLLSINLLFTTILTNCVMKKYFNYDKQCGTIFVSSQAGALPGSPLVPLYGCCKAALIHLGKSIEAEDKFSNTKRTMDVLVAIPGYVASGKTPNWIKMKNENKIDRGSIGVATPYFIANSIMNNLGYSYPMVLSPYIIHGIQFAFLETFLPEYVIQLLSFHELNPVRLKRIQKSE